MNGSHFYKASQAPRRWICEYAFELLPQPITVVGFRGCIPFNRQTTSVRAVHLIHEAGRRGDELRVEA